METEEFELIKCNKCDGTGIKPNVQPPELCEKCQGKLMLDWIENITGAHKISRIQKNILYCIKSLNEFVDMGILSGKALQINEYGLKIIKDFKPEEEEIEETMGMLKQQGYFG